MTTDPLPEDDEILTALRCGDERQVNKITIFLRVHWRDKVVSLVNRLHGKSEDIQDVLDEAIAIFKYKVREGVYNPEQGVPEAYFHGIAHHLICKRIEKRMKNKETPDPDPAQYAPTLGENDVEKILNSSESRKILLALIHQLGEVCQAVLTKFYLEDKSHETISEELGISVDVSKQQKSRCFKRFKELVKQRLDDLRNESSGI